MSRLPFLCRRNWHPRSPARTVEAFAQAVKAMLVAAQKRRMIDYQPWTVWVDDEVKHPTGTHYTTRLLPDREQVSHAVRTMASFWRQSITVDGYSASANGDRCEARR